MMHRYIQLVLLSYALITINCAPVRTRPDENAQSNPAKRQRLSPTPRCSLRFSEISVSVGTKTVTKPFIELKAVCSKKSGPNPPNFFAGYKLLILRNNPFLSLVTVIDLGINKVEMPSSEKYILIGAPSMKNVDISLSSPTIHSVYRHFPEANLLPDPLTSVYSFVITYDSNKVNLKSLQLYTTSTGYQQAKALTSAEVANIKSAVQDMMVLQDSSMNAESDVLGSMWFSGQGSSGNSPAVGLKQWSIYKEVCSTHTLSICSSSYTGFQDLFEISEPTPAMPNKCNIPVTSSEETTNLVTTTATSLPPYAGGVCPTRSGISLNFDELQQYTHSFNPQWITSCSNFLPKREQILSQNIYQQWLHITIEETSCWFSCLFCKNYFGLGFRPDVKRTSLLASESGYFSSDIYENAKQIRNHQDTPIHKEATDFYFSLNAATNQLDVQNIVYKFEEKERLLFNASMNVVSLVYMEALSGMSFQQHEQLMKTLRLIGAKVGKHQHTDVAAAEIVEAIAATFHSQLIRYLIESQVYFTIIVDGSTNTNDAYLIVYIQTMEDNLPVTHLYALIHLEEGETGSGMANALIRRVQLDDEAHPGFMDYFMSRLSVIVSDGASNMVGNEEGFKSHIINFIGRPIPNFVCLNHKLENGIRRSFKPHADTIAHLDPDSNNAIKADVVSTLEYFDNFERNSNKFYNHYVSRGHKRWLHLAKVSAGLDIVPMKLKYFYDIRWSESHYEALIAIKHDYVPMVEDLTSVRNDKTFDSKAKSAAGSLLAVLTDKVYVLVLHEFLDFLRIFTTVSKTLQESSSLIVGKADTMYEMLNAIAKLQDVPGKEVSQYLSECSCPNVCEKCSYDQYIQCATIIYRGFQLTNKHTDIELASTRPQVFKSMVFNLRRYINLDLLQSFDLFRPSSIRVGSPQLLGESEGVEKFYIPNNNIPHEEIMSSGLKMDTVCATYFIPNQECVTIKSEWYHLLKCLAMNDAIIQHNTKETAQFWKFAFAHCLDYWTPCVTRLVSLVLVTPFSSSICERGFSFVNHIKTKERSRMAKSTLESLVCIKANGPDVEYFDSYLHTREWLKRRHIRVDDYSFNGGRKQDEALHESFYKKSRIYMQNQWK